MLIEVYHFSPVKGLTVLIPKRPSSPDYCDIEGVYLTFSLEMCKIWANALSVEKYQQPPFYIYKGFANISILRKIVATDASCEDWELQEITTNDINQEIDQVIAVQEIIVKKIGIYIP